MDTITHALSGALLARATVSGAADRSGLTVRRRVAVGAMAAAFPDLDIVMSWASPVAYLTQHRGVTHSLLMLPLWAVLLALLFALIWRRSPPWRAYLAPSALGLAAHIAGDVITSFGTMVFAPLSDLRAALSTTFIIDLWFSGIILAGLAASVLWRSSRVPAVAASVVLAGYVGFQWWLQQEAIGVARGYAAAQGLRPISVAAQPRPVSPYNWMLLIEEEDHVHYAMVSLRRSNPPAPLDADAGLLRRLDAAYMPIALAEWRTTPRFGASTEDALLARQAWAQPQLDFFRWFAAHPVLVALERGNPSECVWFGDLRFLVPGRDRLPFQFGVCRGEGRDWDAFQRGEHGMVPAH